MSMFGETDKQHPVIPMAKVEERITKTRPYLSKTRL